MVFSRQIVVLARSLVGVSAIAVVACARAETAAIDGVLVLRNGNVLVGAIGRYGDEYRIQQANSTLQIPAAQVERFASSLREEYEVRRAALAATSDAHLVLADWCLRVNLLDEAARELLDVRTLDRRHPGLGDAELRLRQLLVQQTAHQDSESAPATVVAPGDMAATVSPEAPIAISPDAQVGFVRSIQPMLIHSCATGGCHQPGSTRLLQLDRWALRGNGNADRVRRNLASVLGQLNMADPASSELVAWARRAHGAGERGGSRPLSAHQGTLLLAWLNEAAGATPVEELQPVGPEQAPLDAEFSSADFLRDEALDALTLDELQLAAERAQLEDELPAPRQAKYVPRDEFDPEIFNRRRKRAAIKPADAPAPESTDAVDGADRDAVDSVEPAGEL